MKLSFLGTKANIETANRRHARHSALLVSYYGQRIMIDCGADWRQRIGDIAPDAVCLTHAHPDHAWGLADGIACPVYASPETLEGIANFPIDTRIEIAPRTPIEFRHGLTFEAFPVVHSLRAPAIGYRIRGGRRAVFYVPDVVDIEERESALKGIDLYIGDGSSLIRSLVRRHDDKLFGHTTMRAQLGWCAECGVARALFTHCGTGIVTGDERRLGARLRAMGRERGVDAAIAYDGMSVILR
jgi:ribonuclease BN (tRNA processing enzyme)